MLMQCLNRNENKEIQREPNMKVETQSTILLYFHNTSMVSGLSVEKIYK